MGCVSNSKFSIFINGRPRGRIKATRDIRQGDSLSPFLFLLVREVLNTLLAKIHEKWKFKGFIAGEDKVHVSSNMLMTL